MTSSSISFSLNVCIHVPTTVVEKVKSNEQVQQEKKTCALQQSTVRKPLENRVRSGMYKDQQCTSQEDQDSPTPRARQYVVDDANDFLSCSYREPTVAVLVTSSNTNTRTHKPRTKETRVQVDTCVVTNFNNFAGSAANGESTNLQGRCCVIM